MQVNKESECYKIRTYMGLTRSALAKLLGKKIVTIWAYEYETIKMPHYVKEDLLKYYNLFLEVTGKETIM